jgi:hypothetical protein
MKVELEIDDNEVEAEDWSPRTMMRRNPSFHALDWVLFTFALLDKDAPSKLPTASSLPPYEFQSI